MTQHGKGSGSNSNTPSTSGSGSASAAGAGGGGGGGSNSSATGKGGGGGGGGGGGRRRIRRRGGNSDRSNSNNVKNKQSSSNQSKSSSVSSSNHHHLRGPPQSPQIKITLRNIGNAEINGRVAAITNVLLTSLVDKANERLHVDQRMLLKHETNISNLIHDEQAAMQAKEAWIRQQQQNLKVESAAEEQKKTDADSSGVDDQCAGGKEDRNKNGPKEDNGASTVETNDNIPKPQPLLHPPSESSYLATRVLYVVTPKKTRRRGEKPGSVYLVLTAPPIKAQTIMTPQPVPLPPKPIIVEAAETTEKNSATTVDESPANDMAPSSAADSAAAPPTIETAVAPSSSNSKSPAVQQVDYSRDIAQRRLMLVRAVEALSTVARLDVTSKQEYAGCIVEESRNAKAWKVSSSSSSHHHSRNRDRLEGTLEDSQDYKSFMEAVVMEKQALQARPKPAPGGGTFSLPTTTTTTGGTAATSATTENGEPIAALVMHLRSKQEEAKNRKKVKRKQANKNTTTATTASSATATVKRIFPGAKSSKENGGGRSSRNKEESGRKKKSSTSTSKIKRKRGGGGAKSAGGGGGGVRNGAGGGGSSGGAVKT